MIIIIDSCFDQRSIKMIYWVLYFYGSSYHNIHSMLGIEYSIGMLDSIGLELCWE
jgi:hypothetical protein